jgi:NAD(P)-dependent dehydrogenase (short-subunit alcohol dehydrogenase family)
MAKLIRVAMITGAAGNLGQATTRAFVEAGIHTALIDRGAGRLRSVYPELAGSPDHMFIEGVDLSEPSAATGIVRDVLERFGGVDILVNTVGTYRGGLPVEDEDIETWDLLYTANVRTTVLMCKATIPALMESGGGRIINVAARAALAGGANAAAYSVSKSGVVRLTESLAAELRDTAIDVNCVLPGTIDTPQNREAMPDADFNRWATPSAIADVILFLSSDESRGVSGAAIPVYEG